MNGARLREKLARLMGRISFALIGMEAVQRCGSIGIARWIKCSIEPRTFYQTTDDTKKLATVYQKKHRGNLSPPL
jgi:hypothetical protein